MMANASNKSIYFRKRLLFELIDIERFCCWCCCHVCMGLFASSKYRHEYEYVNDVWICSYHCRLSISLCTRRHSPMQCVRPFVQIVSASGQTTRGSICIWRCEWCFANFAIAMETFFGMLEWAPAHALQIRFYVWTRGAVVGKSVSLLRITGRSPKGIVFRFVCLRICSFEFHSYFGKWRTCCRRTVSYYMRAVHGFAHRNLRETKKRKKLQKPFSGKCVISKHRKPDRFIRTWKEKKTYIKISRIYGSFAPHV